MNESISQILFNLRIFIFQLKFKKTTKFYSSYKFVYFTKTYRKISIL